MKFVVISPVKDEERCVEETLRSMACQLVKPVKWIIVDDGSIDRTSEIIEQYRADNDFIEVLRNPPGSVRRPGSAVIRAFDRGYQAANGLEYDLIVKLDCDLSFDPDYFAKLIAKFIADSNLGIASGVYAERVDGSEWSEIIMPEYHAAGASKIIRRQCFMEIGGFIASPGWDTVDEIRAIARGWRSTHFPEAKMKHWKVEGSGIGSLRTNAMHGEVYYRTGGGLLFFFLKVLNRMTQPPRLTGGLAMLWGYLRTMTQRKPLLVTPAEARVYRALLNGRILSKVRSRF